MNKPPSNLAQWICVLTLPLMGFVLVYLTVMYFVTKQHKKRLSVQKFHLT